METEVHLTREELITINNALNEICNIDHIADWEFQTRMGVDRLEARQVLAKINHIIDRMNAAMGASTSR
jgi:hypothetical protein